MARGPSTAQAGTRACGRFRGGGVQSHMLRVSVVVGYSVLAIAAAGAQARQPAAVRGVRASGRIVGTVISGHHDLNTAGTGVEAATLGFLDPDGQTAFTIDFVVQYAGARPAAAPAVVDMIITEHPVGEGSPDVSLEVNGAPQPVVARPRTARAVVASMPFDDFEKLANADTIVERAFDTELEFGPGQLRMLRTVAQRWSGR
jgi:hypothetical protein